MADYYVQMDEGLLTSRLVDRIRDATGLDTDQVLGKLYRLWIATLKLAKDGVIGDRSDAWIEETVAWRGEPGVFAAVIRAHHLDRHGRVRDWADKYGKLEQIRAGVRERVRAHRERERNGYSNAPVTVTDELPAELPGRDVTVTPLPSPSLSSVSPETATTTDADAEKQTATTKAGRERNEQLLAGWAEHPAVVGLVRSSRRPGAVLALLENMATGEMGETRYDRSVIERAVLDMSASDDPRGFTPQGLRAFCQKAAEGVKRTAGRKVHAREQAAMDHETFAKDEHEREEREALAMLKAFERERPDVFAQLKQRAEAQVPKTLTMGRDLIVRGALIRLVREAQDNAA